MSGGGECARIERPLMRSPRPATPRDPASLKLTYLKGTELFRDFTPAQLEPFHHTIRMESCRAGHVFYQPGETGEVMFLLKEGGAQLYRLCGGWTEVRLRAMCRPRRSSARWPASARRCTTASPEATADSVICTLSSRRHAPDDVAFPQFAMRLSRPWPPRWSKPSGNSKSSPSSCRAQTGEPSFDRESPRRVVDGLSHQDIGERLGIYRETATLRTQRAEGGRR